MLYWTLLGCGQISNLESDLETHESEASHHTDHAYATQADVDDAVSALSDSELQALRDRLDALEAAVSVDPDDGSITIGDGAVWISSPDGDGVRSVELGDGVVLVDPAAEVAAFEGVNVHLTSGSGSTHDDGALTGLGNLVIGYDLESSDQYSCGNDSGDKSGSHNLVIGDYHCYEGYGGIVAGFASKTEGASSSVLGGYQNTAVGDRTVAVGGVKNIAGRDGGGTEFNYNVAVGGAENHAAGEHGVVVGGLGNQTNGENSVVVSGQRNNTTGNYSAVVAGEDNVARGTSSGVVAGTENWSDGAASAIVAGFDNEAFGNWSAIVAGSGNTAGTTTTNADGEYSAVVAGAGNRAAGARSMICGGNGKQLQTDRTDAVECTE